MVDIHGGNNCTGGVYDCNFQGSPWQYLANYPRSQGNIGNGPDWFLEALLIYLIAHILRKVPLVRSILG